MGISSWIVWSVFAVLLYIAEMLVPAFFAACFGTGALVGAAASFIGFGWQACSFAFLITSAVLIVLAKRFSMGVTKEGRASGVDALVGAEGVALTAVEARGTGLVKVGGEEWNATSDRRIEEKSHIRVIRVDGNKLIVERV